MFIAAGEMQKFTFDTRCWSLESAGAGVGGWLLSGCEAPVRVGGSLGQRRRMKFRVEDEENNAALLF